MPDKNGRFTNKEIFNELTDVRGDIANNHTDVKIALTILENLVKRVDKVEESISLRDKIYVGLVSAGTIIGSIFGGK
jgi:hypothetical protein